METQTQKQFYPTIGQSFRLIARLILISILISIPFSIIGLLLTDHLNWEGHLKESMFFLSTYVISSVMIIRLGLKRFRSINTSDFKLKFIKIPTNIILIATITTIAAMFIIDPLTELIPMPDFFRDWLVFQPNIFSFLSLVIAAPILEEVLFRGIILEGLLKNYSPKKAIIWSALIFGIAHLNPWQAIGTTVAGLIIGWIYWKTNSIIPGIIIHFINNLIAFAIVALSNIEIDSFVELVGNKVIYSALLAASFIIALIGYKILNKKFKKLPVTCVADSSVKNGPSV